MRWKMIDLKDYKDEPLQFVGVYVLRWQPQWGEPTVGFVEDDEADDLSARVGELERERDELREAIKETYEAMTTTEIQSWIIANPNRYASERKFKRIYEALAAALAAKGAG